MNSTEQPKGVQIVTVQEAPRDVNSLAWAMLDKVAQGSTAVIFALIILWWFSRKAITRSVDNFNGLLDTLRMATKDNSEAQKQLTVTQEHLNETLKTMNQEDINTAQLLGRMDSKLKLIRSLLLEVRSYQTGIPQNRLPLFEVIDEDSDG